MNAPTAMRRILVLLVGFTLFPCVPAIAAPSATVGAYYFEGWYNDADKPNAVGAFANEELRTLYPERQPTFGGGIWRDDSVSAMETQIDLAADHGVQFFTFDWYWYGTEAATLNDGINSGLKNFLLASNRNRMKFNINVCNVTPTAISAAQWNAAADMLMPYLSEPDYLRVDDKPLLQIFDPTDANIPYNYIQSKATQAGLPGVSLAGDNRGATDKFSHVELYNAIPGWGAGETAMPYKNLTYYTDGIRPRPGETWADPGIWNIQSGGLVPGQQSFIPTVMAGFDARPWGTPPSWYFNNPTYMVDGQNWGRTPEAFGDHLQAAIDWIDAHPDKATAEKIIMIYAWNEYGEGGYIAPTLGDPDGLYLDAVASVVGVAEPDLSVILADNFNDDLGSLSGQTTSTGGQTWAAGPSWVSGNLSTGATYGQTSTVGPGDSEASDILTIRANTVPIGKTLSNGTYLVSADFKKQGAPADSVLECGLELSSADGQDSVAIIWSMNQMNLGGSLWSASATPNPLYDGDVHVDLILELDGGDSTATLNWYAHNGDGDPDGTTGSIPIVPSSFEGLTMLTLFTATKNGGIVGFDNLMVSSILLPGDADGNGLVDEADAAILASNWLMQTDATWADGDFNSDGAVNDLDATLLAANWQQSSSAQAYVPEPATVNLLLTGLIGLLILTARRQMID